MIIQGSPEWFAMRAGKLTASRLADAIAKTKTGWGASRENLKALLLTERLTGMVAEGFSNAAMQWGTEKEPEARAAYEFRNDVAVELVGFVTHPTIPNAGASPDGLVGEKGLIEIKCPNTSTMLSTLLDGAIPKKYLTQMAWQLACLPDREWVDFVSYDPRLPEHIRFFCKRYHPDYALIRSLEQEAVAFLAEVDQLVADIAKRYPVEDAA